jgi:glutaredoxin 3
MPAADVVVYTTTYCPYCVRAKALLDKKGARYAEVECTDRPEIRDWLVEASKQRTVPQVFINGRPVGGFSDIAALDKAGQLDPLLAEPPPADAAPLPR